MREEIIINVMTSTRRPIYNCDVLITNGKYFYKVFSDFSGLAKLSIPWGEVLDKNF